MNNKIILFLLIISFLVVLLGGAYTWWLSGQKENLSILLIQAKKTQQEMKADAQRITDENENLQKQLDKIQADALSYVATNTKLQLEKENLEKRINDIQEEIKKKETLLSGVKTETQQVETLELTDLKQKIERLGAENKAAQNKLKGTEVEINLLNTSWQRERAILYYNLGVAYTQANLYDEAVDALERSLKYNSLNPQAHYNLGLIFENVKLNPAKALWHYKLYLEQSPQAQDRDEVMGWIKRLR